MRLSPLIETVPGAWLASTPGHTPVLAAAGTVGSRCHDGTGRGRSRHSAGRWHRVAPRRLAARSERRPTRAALAFVSAGPPRELRQMSL